MAVADAMFIFEVVVESVKSLVESRNLIIRSDFADIFSLELKDPKQMHIVIPDPPPLPPDPPGKKGKKKPPKPKKKGKGEPPPPPEPAIQSGQSVLFASNAEFLIQNMYKFPMEVSLWSKEDNLVYIGNSSIPWDPVFIKYLEMIYNCQEPEPVTVKDEYNVFEEDTAKLMAKISLQIKLSYLGEKVTTAFRTLSEDPTVRKCLYTGINSKVTSYICTMKTTDEDFENNCNKIENKYTKDKQKPAVFADYKNAPGANLFPFNEGDYCCMKNADKPPNSKYTAPQTIPDIDFIVEYIRKVVVSCNDNMRMLTPRPTIRPKVRATDIDRLCYCRETQWPDGELAQRFKREVQGGPCPVCIHAGKKAPDSRGATFDIANIRGPCGRPDCKLARDLRKYIEKLVDEDNIEIDINDIIGPCGSKLCTLAEKIQEFLRHEGPFSKSRTLEGLSTQCACIQQMQEALIEKKSCTSSCSAKCESAESDESVCGGKGCPYPGPSKSQVYNVYYFTIAYDKTPTERSQNTTPQRSSPSSNSPPASGHSSRVNVPASIIKKTSLTISTQPSSKGHSETSLKTSCSKDCVPGGSANLEVVMKCPEKPCPTNGTPSPADSDIVIDFKDINNPCCVETCEVAEKVKDFIAEAEANKKKKGKTDDSCYCDCTCTFKFTKETTYCAICGGYECLGDDMEEQPEHAKPHPCPIYHKLYDRTQLKTTSPWPEDEKKNADNQSSKSSRVNSKVIPSAGSADRRLTLTKKVEQKNSAKDLKGVKVKKTAQENKKTIGKFTANVVQEKTTPAQKKPVEKYPYPPVPRNMGWNWTAEDIPGMKPRPKWKPGAVNKILVRRYRAIREGVDTIAKKKRALMLKKKKIEMKPTLVVTKRDGEYTVQMEVFKKYSKERLLFQYPYDEKQPIIYTIGKTEEEKRKIQKKRDRRERRETRRKSRLLQSTFRDKCQEICVKAYNQAIGVLPLPKPNDPNCPCYTEAVQDLSSPIIDSCSCSEEGTISSSDTDGDDWVIEFTPPMARWDSKSKHPPVMMDNETQYTYLDYKVKVLDKQGVQVPRFFKGPDGKEQCSDLGGFWSPDHVWMEINKDGYIGPDNRWIPMNFVGPDGMQYSAEDGFFTDATGRTLKLGIDGYIDKDGKWAWYSRSQRTKTGKSKSTMTGHASKGKGQVAVQSRPAPPKRNNENPKEKGKQIIAKPENKSGGGKKAATGKSVSYGSKGAKAVVMSVSTNFDGRFSRTPVAPSYRARSAEMKKMAKYREIMRGLHVYADIGELRPPPKSNRASNTPRKKLSPFTMQGYGRGVPGGLEPICSFVNQPRSISQSQSGSCLPAAASPQRCN